MLVAHLTLPNSITRHFNFFRIHLLFFTITPIILSAIFYAANGASSGNANSDATGLQKVTYVDSLFVCFSAMTVTGLVTVNVSATHPFQQFILFLLFIIGDYSVVSLVMVLVRKRFFREHCTQLLKNDHLRRTNTLMPERTKRFTTSFGQKGRGPVKPVTTGLISSPRDARMVDDTIEERRAVESPTPYRQSTELGPADVIAPKEADEKCRTPTEVSNETCTSKSSEAAAQTTGTAHLDFATPTRTLNREQTIQIATPSREPAEYRARQLLRTHTRAVSVQDPIVSSPGNSLFHASTMPVPTHDPVPKPAGRKYTGFGGFPHPVKLLYQGVVPSETKASLRRRLSRRESRMTIHTNPGFAAATTIDQRVSNIAEEESWGDSLTRAARWMPEQLSGLVIGRNSRFFTEELEDNELEQLGGVEYRALRLLGKIVAGYIILFQLIPFAVIAIYFSRIHDWDDAFQVRPGVQAVSVNKTWASLFQVIAAYTGAGMDLVDQSMVPFATCYVVIYTLDIVILAGNHALPMAMRFIIWCGTLIWRRGEVNETLHFLLDHPRRCFLYLFPSHQTWYLVFIFFTFMSVELLGFLALQVGLPVITDLSGWEMFSDGLFQSFSMRASGFAIVPIANMAPSVLFLYVILMYVSIYPIAMSVRSTNVYEERALGVYEHENPELGSDEEPNFTGRGGEVFSKYLSWHIRRQLAFDIWPLTVAIFLIACFERGKLMDPNKSTWFTIFRIIFECTSAYSTIGLSMGTPNNNFSFSGEFGTVSKLIVILVMLQGRHRGLPVAIDRAILLPREYERIDRRGGPAEGKQPNTSSDNAQLDRMKDAVLGRIKGQ